jgi:hypothetical protein
MLLIILEGVLFVALVATVGALFFVVVRRYTPIGRRLSQSYNRRRIDRVAGNACAIHGTFAEHELVRLTSGEAVCPRCYEETVHGDLHE